MEFFTMPEFSRSTTAQKLKIDNTPKGKEKENLEALVDNVLDPVRKEWGHPINVTSGYRSLELNKAVGGAGKSQHQTGEAADIVAGGKFKGKENNFAIGKMIVRRGVFDQIIFEDCGKDDLLPRWIHVSYSRTKNRHQILKMVGGKYLPITMKDLGL